jgi:hypothetical protein
MTRIGSGFNYSFINSRENRDKLKLPNSVQFMELGISELNKVNKKSKNFFENLDWSLHLSRTPICESVENQNYYIEFISRFLNELDPQLKNRLISIGIHLTGSRFMGNGLLGAADSYVATPENLEKASSFIRKLKSACNLPIWIENANFYSIGINNIFEGWAHTRELCKNEKCFLIFDVAHAIVEANNNGIKPECILGCVPWDQVIEFHLSGITYGKDGSMHDGHNSSIPNEVWELFYECKKFISQSALQNNIIYTIEHTSPTWASKTQEYDFDFIKLESILNEPVKNICFSINREKYMKGYLKNVLSGEIPLLETACLQRGTSLEFILNLWIEELKRENIRIAFDIDEVPPIEIKKTKDLNHSFLEFAKIELKKLEQKNELFK